MKVSIRSIVKKALFFLISGGVGLFLAACYGIPFMVKSFKVRVIDNLNSPVPSLRITGADVVGSSLTDALGEADVELYRYVPGYPVIIDVKDVDGDLNGTHADASFAVDPDVPPTIKLAD